MFFMWEHSQNYILFEQPVAQQSYLKLIFLKLKII